MDSGAIATIAAAVVAAGATITVAIISTRRKSKGPPKISSLFIWGTIVPLIVFGLIFIGIGLYMINGEDRNGQSLGWLVFGGGTTSVALAYGKFVRVLRDSNRPTISN